MLVRKVIYKFCQELKILIPLFALLVFLLNTSLSKDSFSINKERILFNQKDSSSQVDLVDLFLANNQYSLATKTAGYALSQSLNNTAKKKLLKQRNRARELALEELRIANQISSWIRVSLFYPTYRDSFVKLAILSLKTNRIFEAKKYIRFAISLDPNSELIKKIHERFFLN